MEKKEIGADTAPEINYGSDDIDEAPLAATQKSRWERSWPVIACGSGRLPDIMRLELESS